jgi:hypothetical protein
VPLFVDYGRAWNTRPPTPDPQTLASIGLGLRCAVTVPAPVAGRLTLTGGTQITSSSCGRRQGFPPAAWGQSALGVLQVTAGTAWRGHMPRSRLGGFRPVHAPGSLGATGAHVKLSNLRQTYLLQQRGAFLAPHPIIRCSIDQV